MNIAGINIFKVICFLALLRKVYGQCDAATRPLTVNASSTPQYVTSPNYGGGTNYPSQSNCEWIVTNPDSAGKVIINVHEAKFDSGDSLTIYQGDSSAGTQLGQGTYTATNSLNEYISAGQSLFIEFTSDTNFNQDGFEILCFVADADVQQQCSETLNATLVPQYLMSSNLPNKVSSYNCTSYIQAVDDYYTLRFRLLFLDCADGNFEISGATDASSNLTSEHTACTTARTYSFSDIDSVYGFASVTFELNSGSNYYGFFMSYVEVFQGINLTYPSEGNIVQLTLAEDFARGTIDTTIAKIEVTTTGDGVVFSFLEDGVENTLFAMSGGTNDVYYLETTGSLNYENTTYYNLSVLIVDQTYPGLSATARFNVTVTDVDDNAPVFTNLPASTTVYRSSRTGYTVFTVSSRDKDITPAYQEVVYTIDGGNKDGLLSINMTSGVIELANDASTFSNSISSYIVTIAAYSFNTSGLSSAATLELIIPIDNPPDCSHNVAYAVELNSYLDGAGTILEYGSPWNCSDDFGAITYSLGTVTPSLTTPLFSMNSTTGEVTLLRSFSIAEVPLRQFSLPVDATDSLMQTTSFTVVVNVTALSCSPKPRPLYIRSDVVPGSTVIDNYNCTDSSLTYTITSQSPAGTFSLSGASLMLQANIYKIRFYSLSLNISNGVDSVSLDFAITVQMKQCPGVLSGSTMTSSSNIAFLLVFLVAFVFG